MQIENGPRVLQIENGPAQVPLPNISNVLRRDRFDDIFRVQVPATNENALTVYQPPNNNMDVVEERFTGRVREREQSPPSSPEEPNQQQVVPVIRIGRPPKNNFDLNNFNPTTTEEIEQLTYKQMDTLLQGSGFPKTSGRNKQRAIRELSDRYNIPFNPVATSPPKTRRKTEYGRK